MPDDRPRLLFIGALPPPRHGVSAANESLLRSDLLNQSFDVHHLDLSDHRPISTVEQFDLGNIVAALSHGSKALWQMLRWRPAVVYVAISQKTLGFLRDVLFLVPARLLGLNTVVHLHGGNLHEFYRHSGPIMRWLIRFALKRTCRAIVLGECLRHCFDALVPADRIVVVSNGVPDVACERSPAERLRVLFLGTLAREKGIEIFLRAAMQVLTKNSSVDFIVAGPWYREREREEFVELARPAGDRIKFVGEVGGAEKTRVLASTDVLVFPSIQQEGQPLTVLEAMAAGATVVASDCGCLREVVVAGTTGFLVPPGDAAAVAARLVELAGDREMCARLGRAGRERFVARYRAEVFVEQLTAVLQAAAVVDRQGPGC